MIDPTHAYARQLSTDYPEAIEKYLQLLNEKVIKSHIVSAIKKLNIRVKKHGWTINRERDYNNIDAQLADIMLAAEIECVPTTTNTSRWSTKLEEATPVIRYWNLPLSKYKKQKENETILQRELQARNVTDNTQTAQEATNKRAEAWRHLRLISKNHEGERLRDLKAKINTSLIEGNILKAKEYTQLVEKE